MKKLLILCLLVLPLILAACGGLKEEAAVDTIKAYFVGDRTAANENLCNTQRLSTQNANKIKEMNITVNEVTCVKDKGKMSCSYQLTSGEESLENTINFTLRSNKLCSRIPMPEFAVAVSEEAQAEGEN